MPNEAEEANENTNIETGIFPKDIYEREKCLKKRYFHQSPISSKKFPKI